MSPYDAKPLPVSASLQADRSRLRVFKFGVLTLEALNTCATCFYFNYLFFYLRSEFGFGNRRNLLVAAGCGFLYIFGSWYAGRVAEKRGRFAALYVGFLVMGVSLIFAWLLNSLASHLILTLMWSIGLCFTWPPLEALACEGERRSDLPRMIGIYNVVWAGGAAVAYFCGGEVLERFGPQSLFWIPAAIHGVQLILAFRLHRRQGALSSEAAVDIGPSIEFVTPSAAASGAKFLRMAWAANVCAYIAMNTVIPTLPEVAATLGLSTAAAGVVGSVWMFGRLAAFLGLWFWTGWHYRFGWLATAYGTMVVSFVLLLLVPRLGVVVIAQIFFGFAIGLIYYSSLLYSLDVGETKSEHAGLHEALIGLGIFLGPAIGGGVLALNPERPRSGVWAVGAVLCVGFAFLLIAGKRRR